MNSSLIAAVRWMAIRNFVECVIIGHPNGSMPSLRFARGLAEVMQSVGLAGRPYGPRLAAAAAHHGVIFAIGMRRVIWREVE